MKWVKVNHEGQPVYGLLNGTKISLTSHTWNDIHMWGGVLMIGEQIAGDLVSEVPRSAAHLHEQIGDLGTQAPGAGEQGGLVQLALEHQSNPLGLPGQQGAPHRVQLRPGEEGDEGHRQQSHGDQRQGKTEAKAHGASLPHPRA